MNIGVYSVLRTDPPGVTLGYDRRRSRTKTQFWQEYAQYNQRALDIALPRSEKEDISETVETGEVLMMRYLLLEMQLWSQGQRVG